MKNLDLEEGMRMIKNVRVGENVHLHSFINLYGCEIGDGSRVGPFVEIQKGVRIGRNCKISSHSFLCEGVELGNSVFIGHGVMFTNDRHPGACNADGSLQSDGDWTLERTWVEDFVSIGTGAVILPGVRIGHHASVGAGAVVTRDVAPHSVVAGIPARTMQKRDGSQPQ
jgi:UDP-2-acetamido-3-amino-2,3-dideoxy-glucuronate N-acetyltransferase